VHTLLGSVISIVTSLRAERSGRSNPGEREMFRTRPDRPWCPPILLYNRYRVSFPEVRPPRRGFDHPVPSSAEIKERVELTQYFRVIKSWRMR